MVPTDEPGKLRLLVADDDKATCLMLKTALANWGYHVIVAEDGNEAWKIVSAPDAPHLLILDNNMPGLDGYTICTKIRQELADNYNPYIIMLTQSSGQENIIKGLKSGANEFLSKPFSPAELQSRIAVGEKIVRYEDALKEQNRQLKDYIAKIETANTLAKHATENLSKVNTPHEQAENIKRAHSALDEIVDVFKSFDPTKAGKKAK